MRFNTLALAAAAASSVTAQRPSDTPICDYYTTAVLKKNTAENQATLLTVLVNTVVIGNYTKPNVGIAVPGILAPGKINNTDVNLLPYFTGQLKSTNRGGSKGVSVNFLDGGGAAPLKKNMPANDEKSNQYFLLTHLYQFFGSLLGCSMQGMSGFDAYTGDASMYKVHKFMDLDYAQVTYFVTQVGLAAASFGVAEDDIKTVAMALNSIFNVRCAPPTAVIKCIACACIVNVALANWQLCIATVNSVAPATQFLPAFWHLTALLVYIVGAIAINLRFRILRGEPKMQGNKSKDENFLIRELQPCRQHSEVRIQPQKESYLFIFMAWLAYVGGVAHIVIATLLFSSMLFIGIGDAAVIIVRYCVSTAVCRMILQFETCGIRPKGDYRC